MSVHRLKTRAEYFEAVWAGSKTHEVRNNDRDFKVDDWLVLEEIGEDGAMTGREVHARVTHMLAGFMGLRPGWVVLSLDVVITAQANGDEGHCRPHADLLKRASNLLKDCDPSYCLGGISQWQLDYGSWAASQVGQCSKTPVQPKETLGDLDGRVYELEEGIPRDFAGVEDRLAELESRVADHKEGLREGAQARINIRSKLSSLGVLHDKIEGLAAEVSGLIEGRDRLDAIVLRPDVVEKVLAELRAGGRVVPMPNEVASTRSSAPSPRPTADLPVEPLGTSGDLSLLDAFQAGAQLGDCMSSDYNARAFEAWRKGVTPTESSTGGDPC